MRKVSAAWVVFAFVFGVVVALGFLPNRGVASIPSIASLSSNGANETDNAIQGSAFCFNAGSSLAGPGSLTMTLPYGTAITSSGATTGFTAGTISPISISLGSLYMYSPQQGNVSYNISNGPGTLTSGTFPSNTPIIATIQSEFKTFVNTVEGLLAPTFTEATTAAIWSSGTATLTVSNNIIPALSSPGQAAKITVAGIAPSGFNGTFAITAATSTTISYSLGSDPGTYTSAGTVVPVPNTL
jgi:hypothetical protein